MSGARWFLALALAAAASLGALSASAGAQTACTTCAKEQRDDARRDLEEAMREFRSALTVYERAVESTERDSSAATRDRLTKAHRELRAASRRLEVASGRLTRMESEAVAVRAQTVTPQRVTITRARTGYMGVNLSAAATTRTRDGKEFWTFESYPKVESVEPGSPAERAGLLAGDVLVALDANDLRTGVIPIGQLLVPGKRLGVRVRREGEVKSFTLVVDERPVRRIVFQKQPGAQVSVVEGEYVEVLPALPVARSRRAPTPAPTTPAPPEPPTPALAPLPPMVYEWEEHEALPLAGANLVPIKGDLREYFGVDRGALITQVGAGTPAARAGLKGGDVIISAGGTRVGTPHDVQMALEKASDDRRMVVELVRKKEKRTATLRW